jgi:hypothetical protein
MRNAFLLLLVFSVAMLNATLWSFLVRKSNQGQAGKGAAAAVLLFLMNSVLIKSYVLNSYFLIPAALGTFLGHFVFISLDRRNA